MTQRAQLGFAEDDAVRGLLDDLNRMVPARDPAVIDLFTRDAMLIGSASGERAEGTADLKQLIEMVYALPMRMSWAWSRVSGGCTGDLGWLLAEGEIVQEGPQRTLRTPYDISLVLVRNDGGWRIRLFHGSEPHHPAPGPDAAATP